MAQQPERAFAEEKRICDCSQRQADKRWIAEANGPKDAADGMTRLHPTGVGIEHMPISTCDKSVR